MKRAERRGEPRGNKPRADDPPNNRDAREHDEDDMARWHANVSTSHARLRALGEAARINSAAGF